VKFIPRNSQFIGRMTIRRSESKIIVSDPTKVTKYLLVDAVGPEAAQKGIKVGDYVVVLSVRHIVQDAGRVFIPFSEEKDVALFATDIGPNEMLMQTPNGKEFVAFDSPEAASSFGMSVGNSNGLERVSHDDVAAGAPV
jgi:hypothetical protein